MLRIMVGGLSRIDSLHVAQAASHAGYSALLGLKSSDGDVDVAPILDRMILSQSDFTVSIASLSTDLLDIFRQNRTRGLKEVLFGEPSSLDLPAAIAALRELGIDSLVQVTTLEEARAAEKGGAAGLVLDGASVQRIAPEVSIPILARGGVGIHTAAAYVVAGASGIILDSQVALCEESALSAEEKTRIAASHDAGFPAELAAEYRTVKSVCDAIRVETFRRLQAVRQNNPFREGSALAGLDGTYVQVSSHDVLKRTLSEDGAKRIILAPGFLLWEHAVRLVLAKLSTPGEVASEYQVIFTLDTADGMSAAMAATVAAPLAEKGVRVGVLSDATRTELYTGHDSGEYLEAAANKLYESQLAAMLKKSPDLRPETDIAIVGVSCVFPKADDLTAYWQNILNKLNVIEEVPKERWDVDMYFDKDRRALDKIYSKWGGFIGPIVFDPPRYGMPPNSVASVDPLQLVMLELTNRALADAGYATRKFDRENTSVIVGVGGGTGELGLGYGFRSLLPHFITHAGGSPDDARQMIQDCDHILPAWTEDSFAGLLLNVVAGRVANRLDLGGTNYSVDAACATSLAAVRLAVTELESHSSNVVVAAGADTMNTPFGYLCFSKTQALSPTGQCRTFDEAADGIVISEGVGVAIFKRLEDAIRDGDRIYAVIKSVGASSDGKDKGLTAPRPIGQMRALDRAYTKAGVRPDTIGLIEAHGTGTVVGDRTEVESMTRFFEGAGTRKQSCALGSVKSMVGHTKCTAGMAGIIKTAMSLRHKVLPPTIGVTKPNSKANFGTSPFYLNTETRPWIRRLDGTPRRAGVSAFGFGGTNFHTVMEEAPGLDMWPEPEQAIRDWPAELFLWKAESADGIVRALNQLSSSLADGAEPILCELAAAVCWEHARNGGSKCLAIIATSLDDLRSKIPIAAASINKGETALRDPRGVYYSAEPLAREGKIAFLFPGQGSQRIDMLSDLAVAIPSIREVFEQADQSLGIEKLGRPLTSFIFPAPTFSDDERKAGENALKQTNVAQPATGAADIAMYRFLASLGIQPHMAAGHSYGELVALCAAGAISFDELIRVSEARGRFIIEAARDELGTMAAVDADESVVAPVVAAVDGVVIANLNSPAQTVISGTNAAVAEAVRRFAQNNVTARQIAVSCAFHSPLVAGARNRLDQALGTAAIASPAIPVFSNTTAAPHCAEPDGIRAQLCAHLVNPVRFVDELTAMYDAGARVFVEVGPGRVLTGLADRTLHGRNVMTIPLDPPGRHGLTNIVHALGMLATAGIAFHAQHLFEGRISRNLDLARLVEQTKPQPLASTAWVIANGRALPANGKGKISADGAPVSNPAKKTWQPAGAAPFVKPPSLLAPVPAPASAAPPAPPVVAAAPPPPPAVKVQAKPAASNARKPVAPVNPAPQTERPDRPAQSERESVMRGHNQLMNNFLQTHRNLMLTYLGGRNGASKHAAAIPQQPIVAAPPVEPPVAAIAPVIEAPVQAPVPPAPPAIPTPAPAAVEVQPAPEAVATKESILERLIALVSERTGYPAEMLGLDLDLEADLGVDSIKRVEILSALQSESNNATSIDGAIEELAKLKTLRAIAEWIEDQAAKRGAATAGPSAASATPSSQVVPISASDFSVSRMLVVPVEAPLPAEPETAAIAGLVLITNDGGAADVLAEQLRSRGVATKVLDPSRLLDHDAAARAVDEIRREHGPISALVHLSPVVDSRNLDPQAWQARLDKDLKTLYNLVRSLEPDLRGNGAGRVLAATRMGGSFAIAAPREHLNGSAEFWPGNAAVCGFLKSVSREWPDVSCRTVDFEFDASNAAIAGALIAELTSARGMTEVSYQEGSRKTLRSVVTPLVRNGTRLELRRDSVIFITGGARGITASIAIELAKHSQCKLILAGRSPLPAGSESAATAGLTDAKQLKAALLKQAGDAGRPPAPASIEAEYRKLLQEREIRSNLDAMTAAGSVVEYRAVDVTDATALGALIDDIYQRHGRIDGVIHGAGIIEDKLLRDKTPASFDRVIGPKITGAIALMSRLRPESLRFLVFFSSVSARYGNRGQCDYAAANEVLDKLAWWLNARWPGRILSINWGPWKTANGMVSSALASQFAKAGVQLIDPDGGQKIFLNELIFGKKEDAEVIWGGPIFHSSDVVAGPSSRSEAKNVTLGAYPLLSAHTEFHQNTDGSALAVRKTDPAIDLYLEHHKLDGKPVMPMVMVLELFAEAAAANNPGKHVSQIRDLRILRGVVFDSNAPQLLHVQTGAARDGIVALSLEVGPSRVLHYSGSAELAASVRPPTQTPGLNLENAVQAPLSIPEIYDSWLFHGRSFAGITSIESIGKDGITGWLKASAPSELFAYKPQGQWLLDPVIIDSGLQLLIVWTRHHFDATPLPSRLAICHLFGAPATEDIRCEIKVDVTGSQTFVSDLKFFDEDGRMVAWLEGMDSTFSRSLNRLGGAVAAGGRS